jgi:secretion/DNA translocation related CpaE-like protein
MTGGSVIGFISGGGGAGSTVLAAATSSLAPSPAFLLDCDTLGGGVDVLLGCEQAPGPRWSQVRLRGGELDPQTLRAALPRWRVVSVLAADRPSDLDAATVLTVVRAARRIGSVILDIPRQPPLLRSALTGSCDLVVLVVRADVRAVTSAAMLCAHLPVGRTVIVTRGTSRGLPAARLGQLLGVPLAGAFPDDPATVRSLGVSPGRLGRTTRRTAESLLAMLTSRATAAVVPA